LGGNTGVMREARAIDYWKKTDKIQHQIEIKNINLNGINGIQNITIQKGIFAICGLNGVGKSTVVSAVKDLIGLDLTTHDDIRITDKITGSIKLDEYNNMVIANKDGERLKNKLSKEDIDYLYLDNEQSMHIINRITKETHFDELLEQYEEYYMDEQQLKDISYIVGKDYDKVSIIDIEDEEIKFPFLKVNSNGVQYNSIQMGVGEHVLFYYYIMISKMGKNSIIIIEEPESFISITSQKRFMNFLAMRTVKFQNQFIITTHSPFIIKNIPPKNIVLLDRYGEEAFIHSGLEKRLVRSLGLEINKKGIIYVEDLIAQTFLIRILKDSKIRFILDDYDIKYVNGFGNITSRLESICKYIDFDIIGIYDGDMRNRIDDNTRSKFQWSYLFLPGEKELEEDFRLCLKNDIDSFIKNIGMDKKNILSALSSVNGIDYHDWFTELQKHLKVSHEQLFDALYYVWIENENNKFMVNKFIEEIKEIIN
jgi:predicted ATPase